MLHLADLQGVPHDLTMASLSCEVVPFQKSVKRHSNPSPVSLFNNDIWIYSQRQSRSSCVHVSDLVMVLPEWLQQWSYELPSRQFLCTQANQIFQIIAGFRYAETLNFLSHGSGQSISTELSSLSSAGYWVANQSQLWHTSNTLGLPADRKGRHVRCTAQNYQLPCQQLHLYRVLIAAIGGSLMGAERSENRCWPLLVRQSSLEINWQVDVLQAQCWLDCGQSSQYFSDGHALYPTHLPECKQNSHKKR